MKQDFCKYLSADLIVMILSRLPVAGVILCKFVCKSLRDLIESSEFGRSHLCNSKSVPGLASLERCEEHYDLYHFAEENDGGEYLSSATALKFTLPIGHEHVDIHSSVNGLLLFSIFRTGDVFVCNPVTRDYIMLPRPCPRRKLQQSFGFGVSKTSCDYKIVWVSSRKFLVYTLGTGSWRSVASSSYPYNATSTFLNGNLHWLLSEYSKPVGIYCFDLDTELFNTFSPPHHVRLDGHYSEIYALEECLAFCSFAHEGFVIWLMKEYGDGKSWTRKLIISYETGVLGSEFRFDPIKVFKDGDILMARPSFSRHLVFFYKNSNTIEFSKPPVLYDHDICGWMAFSYTPSFLSLKTFSVENVSSF